MYVYINLYVHMYELTARHTHNERKLYLSQNDKNQAASVNRSK